MARVLVFAAELPEIIARTGARSGIRWGGPADRHALIAAGTNETWLDRALDNGARFLVVEEEGRIIGQNIYLTHALLDNTRQYPWLALEVQPQHDIYSLGGYVVPEWRGRRLIAHMKGFAARYFVQQGFRRMISLVDADNDASVRAHRHVGAVPLASLTRVRICGLTLVWRDRSLQHVGWRQREPFVLAV